MILRIFFSGRWRWGFSDFVWKINVGKLKRQIPIKVFLRMRLRPFEFTRLGIFKFPSAVEPKQLVIHVKKLFLHSKLQEEMNKHTNEREECKSQQCLRKFEFVTVIFSDFFNVPPHGSLYLNLNFTIIKYTLEKKHKT